MEISFSAEETEIKVDPTQAAAPATESVDVDALWEQLDGYWNSPNGMLTNLYSENGKHYHMFGYWASEGTWPGYVTEATKDLSGNSYTIRFHVDAHTEYETWMEADDYTLWFDLSEINNHRITISSNGEQHRFVYGGATMEEAERHFYDNFFEDLQRSRKASQ